MTLATAHAFWEGTCKHLKVIVRPDPRDAMETFWQKTYIANLPSTELFNFQLHRPGSVARLALDAEVLGPLGLGLSTRPESPHEALLAEAYPHLERLQDYHLTGNDRRYSLDVLHVINNCFKHRDRQARTQLWATRPEAEEQVRRNPAEVSHLASHYRHGLQLAC